MYNNNIRVKSTRNHHLDKLEARRGIPVFYAYLEKNLYNLRYYYCSRKKSCLKIEYQQSGVTEAEHAISRSSERNMQRGLQKTSSVTALSSTHIILEVVGEYEHQISTKFKSKFGAHVRECYL